MILESLFSGLGTTALRELIGWAKKRDDARIRALIREELAKYPPSTIQVTNIDVLVQQVYLLANVGEWKPSEVIPALLPGGYFHLMQKATGHYLDGNGSTVYPHLPNGGVYRAPSPYLAREAKGPAKPETSKVRCGRVPDGRSGNPRQTRSQASLLRQSREIGDLP